MFKKIDNKYRPIPFWSWNERLNTDETKRQIMMMDKAGIGGFFMHARGGLQTEYMGDEWFENVSASVDEAKKRNMHPWAYDENGWPSGFGNGKINGLGVAYQQKYLRFESGEKEIDTTICNKDGIHFYYEVNPFYVDTLSLDVTNAFIKEIYQPYYGKYKNDIEGFFTDEPQISRSGIPWSFGLVEAYQNEYRDDLSEHLIELFKPVGDYETTRLRFWRLVTKLFSNNFVKPIYDWCEERNLKFTGHLVSEENLHSQLVTNGAAMPHYEYFHIPGMDWLGRPIQKCLTPYQVTSVAHQLGKKQILSETFALCGHNVGHNELKGILEWQMVRGVTLLCQHLEGYSLRGIRKRDYPPAMSYQQPWWNDYKVFNDSMSRIGMLLTEGKVECDTLLIHPQSSAWVCFDNDKNEGLAELNQDLLDTIDVLNEKHILFHLGDETIMERHARVEGDALIIGCQSYKTVVLPPHRVLFENTKKLLDQFAANGGKIVTADGLPENNIVSSPYINYTKRKFKDFDLYYFVNSSTETYDAEIAVGNKVMDIKTGDILEFCGRHTFRPFESLVVIDDGGKRCEPEQGVELKALDMSGEWNIKRASHNSITLDFCDYYFDGELVEKDGYVLDIQEKVCNLKRPVDIRCEYKLLAEYIPDEAYLVCETPEKFEISINGKSIDKTDCGYFCDSSFRKLDVSKYLKQGENTITLCTVFKQSDEVYENIEKAKIFESELNKLTYDMEIEPIYVVGKFSVKCDGEFECLDKDAIRFNGKFVLDRPTECLKLSDIEQQGFPFFCGEITAQKTFFIDDVNFKAEFNKKGVNVIKIRVNGEECETLMWEPFFADLSKYLKQGENKIEITMVNNLRNLLGPHHLEDGESHYVCPSSFFKGNSMWLWKGAKVPEWNDGYCFVKTGIV